MVTIDGKIGSWIARAFLPMCISIQLWFIKREIAKRKAETKTNNQYQKWLNVFSMATMIACTTYAVLGLANKIPTICSYIWGFEVSSALIPQDILTMYQIARLEYCFSAKQVHSEKYGYPKWLFVILYIIGCGLILYTLVAPWFAFISENIEHYGCSIEYGQYQLELMSWVFVLYGVWDIVVLLLYVVKVHQIKMKKSKSSLYNLNDAILIEKINFILKKIVILTVTYEVYGVIKSMIIYISDFASIPSNIDIGLFSTLSLIICYLMIEHNNEEYVRLYNFVCMCHCGQSVSDKTDDTTNSQNTKSQPAEPTITAVTVSVLPAKIEQFKNENSVVSVI